MDLGRRKKAITTPINSTRVEAIKEDLLDKIKKVITEVIEYFTKTVDENFNHIQKDLTKNSPLFVNKIRGNMGRGVLQNLLKINCDFLPSIHTTMDSRVSSVKSQCL